jgi:hypothetical protein
VLHACVELRSGRRPTYGEAFRSLRLAPQFLAAHLLYLLLVGAGLVALVVPGLYVAARYAFFGFEVAAGHGLWPSFVRSANLTALSIARLGGLLVLLLLLNLLGAAVLGLGLLITAPLSLLVLTDVYRQLAQAALLAAEPALAPGVP